MLPLLEKLNVRNPWLWDGDYLPWLHAHKEVKAQPCIMELHLLRGGWFKELHRAYLQAGAQALRTCTREANEIQLKQFGKGDLVDDINTAAAENAREAATPGIPILGTLGPTGLTRAELHNLSLLQLRSVFGRQAHALARGGVHALVLDGFNDYFEIKVACASIRQSSTLPVLVLYQPRNFDAQKLFTAESILAGGKWLHRGWNLSTAQLGHPQALWAAEETLQRAGLSVSKIITLEKRSSETLDLPLLEALLELEISALAGGPGTLPEDLDALRRLLKLYRERQARPHASVALLSTDFSCETATYSLNAASVPAIFTPQGALRILTPEQVLQMPVSTFPAVIDFSEKANVLGPLSRKILDAPERLSQTLESFMGRPLLGPFAADTLTKDYPLATLSAHGAYVWAQLKNSGGSESLNHEKYLALGRQTVKLALAAGLSTHQIFLDPALVIDAKNCLPALQAMQTLKTEHACRILVDLRGMGDADLKALLPQCVAYGTDLFLMDHDPAELTQLLNTAARLAGRG